MQFLLVVDSRVALLHQVLEDALGIVTRHKVDPAVEQLLDERLQEGAHGVVRQFRAAVLGQLLEEDVCNVVLQAGRHHLAGDRLVGSDYRLRQAPAESSYCRLVPAGRVEEDESLTEDAADQLELEATLCPKTSAILAILPS